MKHYSQRWAVALLSVVSMAYLPFAAAASTTYGFYGITSNNAGAVAEGMANLAVEVIDMGSDINGNLVQFKFTNNSSSTLTDVYFDDGTLLGIAAITSGTGVSFSQGASPSDLPGGNNASPAFQVTQGFSADSNPPVSHNGVTAGEWLGITFNLAAGKTYANTLAALALPNGGGAGDLRIGVHVQSFASGGGSESFVNVATPVPEAQTYAMMLAGLGLLGWVARRRTHAR